MSAELTWMGRAVRAWRRYTWKEFGRLATYNLKLFLTGKYREHAHLFDDSFDRKFSVETRGTEETEYLTADSDAKVHGRRYEAATVEQMAVLMAKLQSLDLAKFSFYDLGSGKGRALFIASDFPFKRIVGIEYGRELHEVALRNISSYRNPKQQCFDITSVLADASAIEFPSEPIVCFMNNPFDEVLIQRVAMNMVRTLTASPREFVLIYLHSNHPGAIEKTGGWERLHDDLIPPRTPYVIWRWRGDSA